MAFDQDGKGVYSGPYADFWLDLETQMKAVRDQPLPVYNDARQNLNVLPEYVIKRFRKRYPSLIRSEIEACWRYGIVTLRDPKEPLRCPKLVLQPGLSMEDVKKAIAGLDAMVELPGNQHDTISRVIERFAITIF